MLNYRHERDGKACEEFENLCTGRNGGCLFRRTEKKGRARGAEEATRVLSWFFECSRNILVPRAQRKIKREEREGESAL